MQKFSLDYCSDKVFWHKYMPFYSEVLAGLQNDEMFDILEIGVLNSRSIFQWRQRFPGARITGCDIAFDPDWYSDENVRYLQFDQSDLSILDESIKSLTDPRILIDDGSHVPFHQMMFLHTATRAVVKHPVEAKRVVIIEDLHTSLEQVMNHKSCKDKSGHTREPLEFPSHDSKIYKHLTDLVSPIGLLLALEKVQNGSQTRNELLDQISAKVNSHECFSIVEDIVSTCLEADRISIHKRSTLPDACWKCGSHLFDLGTLCCQACGEDGYKHADSISAALEYGAGSTLPNTCEVISF